MTAGDGPGDHPLAPLLSERLDAGGEVARLDISLPRFVTGIGALAGLGGVVLWIAARGETGPVGAALFALAGLGALSLAVAVARAGRAGLVLTHEALVDTTGRVVCRIADIQAVERGVVALRPSNGFALRLRSPARAGWHPGLWWRVGRRVGIGGLTPTGQGRAAADLLGALVARRNGAA